MGVVEAVWAFVLQVWDFIVGLLTGKSAIERICLSGLPQYIISTQIEKRIKSEASLADGHKFDLDGKSVTLKDYLLAPPADADPSNLCSLLVKAKNINTASADFTKVQSVLCATIKQFCGVSKLLHEVEEIRSTKYDSENNEHEELLMSLWNSLKPDVRLSARKTEEWGDIGFQGRDPATDFRGMGLLGLRNLVDFASSWKQQSQAILADTATHTNWYGMAIAGISLTGDIYTNLKKRNLNSYFYRYGSTLDSFTGLYAHFFTYFNACWAKANPPNVMSYMYIHNDFLSDVLKQSEQGTLSPLPK